MKNKTFMKKSFSFLAVNVLLVAGITSYSTQPKTTNELIVDDVLYCAGLYYSVAKTENNSTEVNNIPHQIATQLKWLAIKLYPKKEHAFTNKINIITTEFNLYRDLKRIHNDYNISKIIIKSYIKCNFFIRRINNIIKGKLTPNEYYSKYGSIPRDIIGSN